MKTRFESLTALLAFALGGIAVHAQATDAPTANPPAPNPSTSITAQQNTGSSQAVSEAMKSNNSSSNMLSVHSDSPSVAHSTGSQVRIVRLSQVKGEAQMDRNMNRGFEAAIANLPIVQGSKLKTGEGVAEVEFEDNSTLRLTPNTLVEFPRLGRNEGGSTASNINVVRGTVYVSMANTKGNEFTVSFGKDKANLPPSSHVQLYVGNPTTRLGVYEGAVQVEDASGTTLVGKKKALLFDSASQARPTLVSSVEKTPYDAWDKDAVEYHKRYTQYSAFGGSSPGYGVSDLNYYGSFVNIGGCGSMWRPYFASAAWDPFANGTWAWYQDAGYSWVSPYPWGWAPYHTGSWQYCSTGGWGWRPGGNWNGLSNSALLVSTNNGPTRPKSPLAPKAGTSTFVPVNTRPIASSSFASAENFVFRKDSAGLGVPRQTFDKLDKVSSQVAHHGMATSMVAAPSAMSSSPGHANTSTLSSRPAGSLSGASAPSASSGGMSHGNAASAGASSHR